MAKLLLCGYYGFGNLGDDVLLDIITDEILKTIPDAKIYALLPPDGCDDVKNVTGIARNSFFAVLKAVISSDMIIFGGGSIFQDATSQRSLLYYSMICIAAIIFGKKYFLIFQGFGPINKKLSKAICSIVFKKAAYASFRDRESSDLAHKLVRKKMPVYADPVFLLKKAALFKEEQVLKKTSFILKNIDGKTTNEIADLAMCLKESYNMELYVYILFPKQDKEVSESFAARTGARIVGFKSSTDLISDMAQMDIIVSVRYHGIVLSACAGAYCIPVSYDPKIDSLACALGINKFGQRTYENTADAIKSNEKRRKMDEKAFLLCDLARSGMDEFVLDISKNLEPKIKE